MLISSTEAEECCLLLFFDLCVRQSSQVKLHSGKFACILKLLLNIIF